MGRGVRIAGLWPAVAVALAVSACGPRPGPTTAPSTVPPPGVSVSVQQWRSDVPVHRLQIAARNDTATPVYFQDVQLSTASFQVLPPQRVDTTLGRTPRTDFSIPYGTARCDRDRIPQVSPAVVIAHLRVGDGPLREVRFAVPHPDPILSGLLTTECGEFILRESVGVAFGDSWDRVGKELHGVIRVEPKNAAGPVTVDDVAGTTHYDLKPASGKTRPVTVVRSGPAEIPVVVTPTRCDPHAFGEAKQAFLFSLWASAGGGATYRIVLTPSQEAQRLFQSYAADVCGFPSS
ncbi:hypothetical protein Pth03_24280 [Planotetraspora thailandica]|uniref:Lipoprotein n=1 Tax=Planotetraspora thailandica TaxID=487172 RepID=A0A8J3UXW0_9ACTN|nr:hypothetical protein [Planotetraspora thailandica]GII54039.1 hypothetical protein Pth03_24280 [Planotetraspora thailandica]